MLTDSVKFWQRLGLIAAVFIFIPSLLCSQVISTFDTADSLENWRAVGDGSFSYETGTGNPDACMRVDDDATGNLLIALAPAKFLGEWSNASDMDSLTVDIFVHLLGGSPFNPDWIFRISGPGGSAIALEGSDYNPPLDEWTHYAVPIDSTEWTIQQGHWEDILQHVTMLEVLAEFINGDEYVRLDNPSLSFTPNITEVSPPIYSEFENQDWGGWSFVNTGSVSIQSNDGNPAGYVRINDRSGVISRGIASSEYLGNWQGLMDAAAIQLDLNIVSHSGDLLTNHPLIKISGPGGTATVPFDSTILEASNHWKSYSFLLNPTVWTVEAGTWSDLLNNVTDISIYPEFFDGTETIGLDNFRLSNDPPEVAFSTSQTFAFQGDEIQFYDQTKFVPDTWLWSFGDGQISNMQNPTHQYSDPGTYSIRLITSNEFGVDSLVKNNYIEISGITDSILYQDDFEDNTINPAWSFRNGSWVESGGLMRQTSNYWSGGYIGGAYAIVGSKSWPDYTLSADISSADNDNIGLVFRYQDPQNFYLFAWELEGSLRFIKRFVDGVETNLALDNVPYDQNTWYHVKIITDDSLIQCYIDSSLVFDVTDTTFATGKVGLYCYGNTGSYWDNFSVVQTHYTPTGITTPAMENVVKTFQLEQNYPNPFNPSTHIRFYLPQEKFVVLNIYNILGQRIKSFQFGALATGEHEYTWDGTNSLGKPVASGVYLYELNAGNFYQTKKMFLLR